MKRLKALLIDDNPVDVDEMMPYLNAIGDECNVASCLAEATEMFSAEKYDYVLLDLEIPNRKGGIPKLDNGELFLMTVRQTRNLSVREMPVIITSGHFEELTMRKMYEYGINDYLMKDFSQHDLNPGKSILKCTEHLRLEAAEQQAAAPLADADELPAEQPADLEWLRVEHGVKQNTWSAIAANGVSRSIVMACGSKLDRLLGCIFDNYRSAPNIDHKTIQGRCGWNIDAQYYHIMKGSRESHPERGPLRHLKGRLMNELGIELIIGDCFVQAIRPSK